MKKILSLAMVGALCASFMAPLTVSANEDRPAYEGDCSIPVDDANLPANDENRLPVECRYIQKEGETSIPVTGRIFAPDADEYVDVYVPAKLTWYATMMKTDDTAPVKSPTFKIVNMNKRGNIQLTMKSFKKNPDVTVSPKFKEDNLRLEFTNELSMGNLDLSKVAKEGKDVNVALGDLLYSTYAAEHDSTGKSKSQFNFGFTGEYTGTVPLGYDRAFLPAYNMILDIAVDSVESINVD